MKPEDAWKLGETYLYQEPETTEAKLKRVYAGTFLHRDGHYSWTYFDRFMAAGERQRAAMRAGEDTAAIVAELNQINEEWAFARAQERETDRWPTPTRWGKWRARIKLWYRRVIVWSSEP